MALRPEDHKISFPYTAEECWKHRPYAAVVDGKRLLKCSLCGSTLKEDA